MRACVACAYMCKQYILNIIDVIITKSVNNSIKQKYLKRYLVYDHI